MVRKKYLATYVLIGVTVGAAITSQLTGAVAEFLYHGFLAAMIGGLADWFGTVALFRKPLGISYKTAILSRNRQRIIDEMMKFIGDDLLNIENVKKIIDKQNLVQLFLYYLEYLDGRTKLKEAVHLLLCEIARTFNSQKFSQTLLSALKEGKKEYGLLILLEDILHYTTSKEKFDLFFNALIDDLKDILKSTPLQNIFQNHVEIFFEDYSHNSLLRKFYINEERRLEYLTNIFEKALEKCDELKDEKSPDRLQIKNYLSNLIYTISQNKNIISYFEKTEKEILNTNPEIVLCLSEKMDSLKNENNISRLSNHINLLIDEEIQKLHNDKNRQEIIDLFLKRWLYKQIEKNTSTILSMAKNKLDSYSEHEFISMVESKVADDLQMIRINGSFVGGLAGMFLYGIFYVAERLFAV